MYPFSVFDAFGDVLARKNQAAHFGAAQTLAYLSFGRLFYVSTDYADATDFLTTEVSVC